MKPTLNLTANSSADISQSRTSSVWFVAMVISAALLVPFLFGSDLLIVKIAFILIVLLTRWRFSGAMILVSIQAYLLFQTSSDSPFLALTSDNLLLATISGLTIILTDWFRTHRRVESDLDWTHIAPKANPVSSENIAAPSQSSIPFRRLVPAAVQLVIAVLVCVGIARSLLVFIPLDNEGAGRLRLRASELRTIQVGLVATAVYCIALWIINELRWRSMSAAQARIHLQGILAQWLDRDVRRIAKIEYRNQIKRFKRSQRSKS